MYNDELVFIHKGEGTFTLDEKLIEVKTGTVIFIPRGMWHGLENTGQENILMVFQYSPLALKDFSGRMGSHRGWSQNNGLEQNMPLPRRNMGWSINYSEPAPELLIKEKV